MNWLFFTLLSAVADGQLVRRVGKRFVGIDTDELGGLTDTDQTIAGAKTFSASPIVEVDDDSNSDMTEMLTLRHTTSGTPAPGIGAALMFEAEGAAGPVLGAAVAGELTSVSSGSEVGRVAIYPAAGGHPVAGLQVQGIASGAYGFAMLPSTIAGAPTFTVYGGANAGLTLKPAGSGALSLQGGNGVTKIGVSSAGIGFFGTAPTAQPTAITDANGFTLAGSDQVDAANLLAWLNQNTTKLNAVIAALRTLGIIAT